ncbi:MAG: TonB-dependent receptor, partial [Thermoanaerobaculia bacterium]
MNSLKRGLLVMAALLLVAVPIFAQNLGSLTGTVTLEGAPLPGATVTISSPALQGTRTAYTDVNGNYNFGALPPGEYRVAFDMESMQSVSRTAKVTLGGVARANAVMRLSALAEAITVTAAAPAVLETQQVQTNIQAELIEDLPIGRTIQATVTLAPGVNSNGPGGALVVGGGYAYDTLYVINGAVTNENIRGQTDNLFIEDAIQETTVLTGAISAEYGRFTGGVVSAITKSGGNEFHGTLRDSFDNPSWDSTTDAGEKQQASVLNETYEATLGGRIIRDRLWFFGAGRSAETSAPGFFIDGGALATPVARESMVTTDDRYEGKLTGQITPKHSLVGSYLSYKVNQTPHCAFGCWDINTVDVDGRDLPRDMKAANYSGILTNNLIVEAGYSSRSLEFVGSGGNHVTKDLNNPRDLALGTWAYDYTVAGGAWGAPIFCGVCDTESRTNEDYNLKGTYYLATKGLGTHNLVAGYDNFAESRFANNYQSGSNFDVYVYSTAPEFEANGTFRPIISAGDVLRYVPITVLSQGSDFVTNSIYLNDKWDLSSKWSFNVGARYDVNDGKDSAGKKISDDSNISPRLGATFDAFGNGRFRATASYSKYVSRIQEGIGGGQGGGNPSYFFYYYDGPQIGGVGSGLDSFGVLENLFKWFLSPAIGGLKNTSNLVGVSVPGLNTRFDGSLKSPNVDEFTIGVGAQIGSRGFVRADYIDKTWNDFYHVFNTPKDQIENPFLKGEFLDFKVTGNTNDIVKEYKAVQTQASYRAFNRVNLGLSYTWSEATGNEIGETAGSGPSASVPNSYREYKAFAQNNPLGFLPNDQTHRARLWASYEQRLGFLGSLNVSVLQRFDSGTPYSATANVNVGSFVTNPGYATPPATATYFFSDRGEFSTDDVTATDLALNWNLPIRKVNLFVQGELINAFDEQAITTASGSVTAFNAASQNRFNPFTKPRSELKECPQGTATATCVAGGFHWRKNAAFGTATGPGSYQL